MTSKSNQFISVPNCTEVVNLVKFYKRFIKYHVNELLACGQRATECVQNCSNDVRRIKNVLMYTEQQTSSQQLYTTEKPTASLPNSSSYLNTTEASTKWT